MEDKNQLDVCCICLENVLIPVEPLCFQCRDCDSNESEISCYSMKRICLVCMERYLDLHKHRMERSIKKKCIFCPMTCPLHQFPKSKTFRVDYLLMDRDVNIRSCPYCSFQSNHLKVARHVFSECPLYYVECDCGYTCKRQDMREHVSMCDKFHMCDICKIYILETETPRHMYYEHDKTRCFTCHEFINMSQLSDHIISECPERLITCEICSVFIRFKLFKNHLRRHVVEISRNLQLIKNKLKEEEQAYQHIQKLIRGLTTQHHQQEEELLVDTTSTGCP